MKRDLKAVFNTPANLVDIQRVHNQFRQILPDIDQDSWVVDAQGITDWFSNASSLVIYYNFESNSIAWESEYFFDEVFDELKINFDEFLTVEPSSVNLKIRHFMD